MSNTEKPFKTFIGSYPYQGGKWQFEILAADHADAEARFKALPWGKIDGELSMRIPASVGWWIPLVCAVRNFFVRT